MEPMITEQLKRLRSYSQFHDIKARNKKTSSKQKEWPSKVRIHMKLEVFSRQFHSPKIVSVDPHFTYSCGFCNMYMISKRRRELVSIVCLHDPSDVTITKKNFLLKIICGKVSGCLKIYEEHLSFQFMKINFHSFMMQMYISAIICNRLFIMIILCFFFI